MKKPLEAVGFMLMLWGAAGLVHHFFDWFRLWAIVYRVGPLRGHEVAASIAMVVLGFAVSVAAEKVGD